MITVQLKLYKGAQILKGENGQIMNQNQTLKLSHDTKEWHNFINTMYRNGWGRVDVLAAKIDKGGEPDWDKYKNVDPDVLEKIKAEVQSKLKKTSDKPLTQDQKDLKEVKEQLAKFIENSGANPTVTTEEIKAAQELVNKANEDSASKDDTIIALKADRETAVKTAEEKDANLLSTVNELRDANAKNEKLEKKVKALLAATKDITPLIDEEAEKANAEHERLFGKKPHHASSFENIVKKNKVENERIAAENN